MKKYYIVFQICQNEKYYCHAWPVTESDNLLSVFEKMGPGIISANMAPTKKRAAEIVETWRAGYIANKNYMFQTEE